MDEAIAESIHKLINPHTRRKVFLKDMKATIGWIIIVAFWLLFGIAVWCAMKEGEENANREYDRQLKRDQLVEYQLKEQGNNKTDRKE